MTLAHWIYLIGALGVIAVMLMRKDVVIPALVATFAVGWAFHGGFIDGMLAGLTTIFNANITAAKELFTIILLICFMVAMLNALKRCGADRKMVAPIRKLMVNGHVAYWVLFIATAVISTAFWPTPAVPLVAAVLMPAAAAAGLPNMGMAVAVSLAGQGMALSGDALLRIAPMLSAQAIGIQGLTDAVWLKGIVLSLVVGGVSVAMAYATIMKTIRQPGTVTEGPFAETEAAIAGGQDEVENSALASGMAIATVVTFVLIVVAMGVFKFTGGDAGGLIGGAAVLLMLVATILKDGPKEALTQVAERITEGFVFAMKIMGAIIPIAAFFFMGGPDLAKSILGPEGPGFLFDMVQMMQGYIPQNEFLAAFGVLIVGIVAGMDGSGFSGLPLTGALAGALSAGTGVDPTMLAAVGQMSNIWTGGGTIVAWSSLVAVAGFAGVSVTELARKNLVPVLTGLIIATIVAVMLW